MALLELDFRSGYLNNHEEVWVILPDRDPEEDGYATLWLFHGENQDCSEWVRNTGVERYANERGIAVVMPTTLHSYGMDMKYGVNYFSMLTKELWHELHFLLPCLSRRREKNFAAGASMGGYVACKLALACPERFACAGSFSGVLDIVSVLRSHIGKADPHRYFANAFGSAETVEGTEDDLFFLAEKGLREGKELPRLWCVCGRQDIGCAPCRAAADKLRETGLDVLWEEGDGAHDFAFWDRQIVPFLDWIGLGKEEER